LISFLIIPLLLAACGAGSGGYTYPYDGAWTTYFINPADCPVAGTNETVVCDMPAVTLNIVQGAGSTTQVLTYVITKTTTNPTTGVTTPVSSVTQSLLYLISIAISELGDTNAIVNGSPLTGKCVSTVGCAAQTTGASLSLTR
jgi:hypothetical protein